MAIVKGSFESNFVTIYNQTARDTTMSLQARGLLVYLLSLPGDWEVHRKQLAKDNKVNEKTIQKYINELRESGYIQYIRTRKNGRLSGGDYHVFPIPQKPTQKQLKATDTKTSTTDPKSYLVEKIPGSDQVQHTKKELYKEKKESNSKPEKSGFSLTDFFTVALNRLNTRYDGLTEDELEQVELIWLSFQPERPNHQTAYNWIHTGLKHYWQTQKRTARAGAARDSLNDAVVNQLQAQAEQVNRKTAGMQPGRDHSSKDWSEGLFDD